MTRGEDRKDLKVIVLKGSCSKSRHAGKQVSQFKNLQRGFYGKELGDFQVRDSALKGKEIL